MIEKIHALGRFVGAPSLDRMRTLLDAVGNPHKQLQFIHIVGTNGKGSTAHMLASVLERAGHRVGLFTSPYLVEFGERMRVNGQNITATQLQTHGARVFDALQTCGLQVGEFECVTAIAMLHFLAEGCDIVVLETGLGGEFDATNVIDTPQVLLFTPISLDHTVVLGDTVAQIAQTKAQTIKQGGVVLDSPTQHPDASRMLRAQCAKMDATYVQAQPPRQVRCDQSATRFTLGVQDYRLGMLGNHQAENAALAIAALDVLAMQGWAIDSTAVQQGLAHATHAGRLECICHTPYTLLDGAHNQAGVAALCAFVQAHMPQPAMVVGMVSDKAVDDCLRQFATVVKVLYFTDFDSPRAIAAAELCKIAQQYHPDCRVISNPLTALQTAQAQSTHVVVAGSLYLVGEVKKRLAQGK